MELSAIRPHLADALASAEELTHRLRLLLVQADGGGAVQVPGQGPWTRGMVAQLWPAVEHLQGVNTLFQLCAARPNQVVTYPEVLAASGLDHMQQKNEHARLSRVSTELFGERRWPIQFWQSSESAGGHMLYRMGGTVADWWLEIAHPAQV